METAAHAFVMELGRALLRIGTPAHRLEEALGLLSRRLGLEAELFSIPTGLFASFAAKPFPRTCFVRSDPGEVDLEKLTLLDEIADMVARGDLPAPEGVRRIREVFAAPHRYGLLAIMAANVLLSAALATVFGCDWKQAAVAGLIGLIVGLLRVLARHWSSFGRVFDVAAATLGAFAASAAAAWAPGAHYLTLVTGLIVLLPGFTLTVALTELSTFHLVAGATRLVGALVVFLKLAFGVALGGRLGAAIFGEPGAPALDPVSAWKRLAALGCAAFAFTVIYQARPRDTGWILLASIAALLGADAGTRLLGADLGPLAGAFVVTAGGNLYARLLDRPARVVIAPGLLLLVPGALGFQSVSFLLERDAVAGVSTAFSMALAATGLAAGVLFATLCVPPRKIL
jgi:uncharacterized membrane protein YjjP (DUF1212 family)